MTTIHHRIAPERSVIRIDGPDAIPFLQGIVSNDVEKAGSDRAVWAAYLTPQGKYLFDFFIARLGDVLLLDCEADRRDDLIKRLSRYKLRSKVTIAAVDEMCVGLIWGAGSNPPHVENGAAFADPRLAAAGIRLIAPAEAMSGILTNAGGESADFGAYERHRIALGLPDGARDLEVEKDILLEAGFHELHGVDWKKGCYMGQELTARTYYRGLIKKRLLPVTIDGPPPAPGTQILDAEGKDAGTMRSSIGDSGLALIRLAALEDGGPLTADAATLTPRKPDWLIPNPGDARAKGDAAE
jgi:folate-binding protein YgfZ